MGDSACWLHRVCLECGRFVETERGEGDECPHCGADMALTPPGRT